MNRLVLILIFLFNLFSKCMVESRIVSNDIDISLTTPALIAKYGYPCEPHPVITDDGFILTLHRIPYGKHNNNSTKIRQPILIQHGIIADSSCFFFYKEKSLPFLLAEAGYDVWLSNIRGTVYSSDHIRYEPSNFKYWDWSWDEIAAYDLSKIIKYIGHETNQTGNILYIGHSMGTTIFFALMASQPEYNSHVKAMFALSPVVFTKHIRGPLHFFQRFSNLILRVYRRFGVGSIIPHVNLFRKFVKHGCSLHVTSRICQDILFTLTGFDKKQLDINKFLLFMGHFPQPTSIRTVIHYGQGGDFKYFDFGKDYNMIKYGTEDAPEYNISQISVPIALYVGNNDWLTQHQDVDYFWNQLPSKFLKYVVPFDNFNHLDFIWSNDVMDLLYNQLLADIKLFS